MKAPCVDCLTLSICRQKVYTKRSIEVITCPFVRRYIDALMNERPMYMYTRVNKVRKALGLKKRRVKRGWNSVM